MRDNLITGPLRPRSVRSSAIALALLPVLLGFVRPAPAPAQTPATPSLPTTTLVHDGDRIVFVGDSITGQGYNAGNGWAHQIEAALAKSHPANPPHVVSLGGSGQTVGGWLNVEKRSQDQSVTLDVKQFDVKTELSQHADIVVVMLGMNDVLSPSMNGDSDAVDRWAGQYSDLLDALKARTTPRLLGLCTVSPCTEAKDCPKNLVLDAMDAKIVQLAAAQVAAGQNAVVLPVGDSVWRALDQGRETRPDFHVTRDFVHPNDVGHMAIARGMLAGLGEAGAVKDEDAAITGAIAGDGAKIPGLSYELEFPPGPLAQEPEVVRIHYFFTPGDVDAAGNGTVTVPGGWTASPAGLPGTSGVITLSGTPDHLHNLVILQRGAATATLDIPPPWLAGTGSVGGQGWIKQNSVFDPVAGHLSADDTLCTGQGFGTPLEIAPGKPLHWTRITPSLNYAGGPGPGAVDMSEALFFNTFQIGYGARWIYSPDDRTVHFKLGSNAFADNGFLTVWLNGTQLYAGQYHGDRGKVLEAPLKKGWNPLVWKANHLQWQWTFSLDLDETEKVDDLRFSATPK